MKNNKPNIEFVTDSGRRIILKWDKEYKAYDSNNNYLGLGAMIPKNLIKYIKKNY